MKRSSKVTEKDNQYINDLNAAILLKTPARINQTLYIIFIFIIAAVIWMAYAELDEVTIGVGKIIPSQQIQVIQNLEGGILKKIAVQEGDMVETGQLLLTIDETRFLSEYREQDVQANNLKAELVRLRAELSSIEIDTNQKSVQVNVEPQKLDFSKVDATYPDLISRQRALYLERTRSLSNQINIIKDQVEQKIQQLNELNSNIQHAERSYQLVRKELDLTRPLANSGVVSEVELIKLERVANDVKGELESNRLLKPKLLSEIKEAENKRREVALKFRSEIQEELAKVESELNSMTEVLVSLQDRLTRTNVFSPVKGTIKTIKINTIGGVIQPGMDLIEIVPLADSMLVEAQISPKDIAFLRPNLPAVIKLTAYDFAIYGGLHGVVEHISADTIKDEKDNEFYLIRVRTADSYTDGQGHLLPIIPGMTATVDVITGKKTVLNYLLKPIVRAKQNAMREK